MLLIDYGYEEELGLTKLVEGEVGERREAQGGGDIHI